MVGSKNHLHLVRYLALMSFSFLGISCTTSPNAIETHPGVRNIASRHGGTDAGGGSNILLRACAGSDPQWGVIARRAGPFTLLWLIDLTDSKDSGSLENLEHYFILSLQDSFPKYLVYQAGQVDTKASIAKFRNFYNASAVALSKAITDGTLKSQLRNFTKNVDLNSIEDPQARNLFEQMRAHGLLEDIAKSQYVPQEECIDHSGVYEALTTKQAPKNHTEIGGKICFDINYLNSTFPTDDARIYAELIGLFLHDHARHFGIDDKDDCFGFAMAKAYFDFQQSK